MGQLVCLTQEGRRDGTATTGSVRHIQATALASEAGRPKRTYQCCIWPARAASTRLAETPGDCRCESSARAPSTDRGRWPRCLQQPLPIRLYPCISVPRILAVLPFAAGALAILED